MHDPRLHGVEHLVLHETVLSSNLAKLRELLVVGGGEDEMSVLRGHHLVRHDVGVVVANPWLPLLLRKVVHALVLEEGHRHVEHGDVHMLAEAGHRLVPQCRQNADTRVQARGEVKHRKPHFHRLAVGHASNAHGAAHRLDQHVVRGALAVWAGVAEARDAAVDEAREFLLQLLVTQAILVQGSCLEVFDEDVALLEDAPENLSAPLRGVVQGDTVLVAVAACEVRGDFGILTVTLLEKGRGIPPRVVARLWTLHLDNRCAHVPEEHGGRWACQNAREVQHPEASKRPRSLFNRGAQGNATTSGDERRGAHPDRDTLDGERKHLLRYQKNSRRRSELARWGADDGSSNSRFG
mmetsp:Transcript_87942/g.247072  ORF Transcript_87942/g.247072 Transcript_87942/m.247072 type:complete len:352 (+) Transcript_87942:914-1969(+)